MLSNIIISSQKFVFVVDKADKERIALKTINGLLEEQGQNDFIKLLKLSDLKLNESNYKTCLDEISNSGKKLNVILPPLSNILLNNSKKSLYQFVHQLKQNSNVKQIFLWATTQNVFDSFTLACLEYMADLVMYIESKTNLTILTKKSGGSVTNKNYKYTLSKDSFQIEPIKQNKIKVEKPNVKVEQLGTFKIELEEDELVARNALKMPYEKTSESEIGGGGNIIYTPDKDDDFDEEDPDEDLYI